jgi:hypothetical protein
MAALLAWHHQHHPTTPCRPEDALAAVANQSLAAMDLLPQERTAIVSLCKSFHTKVRPPPAAMSSPCRLQTWDASTPHLLQRCLPIS